MPQGDRDRDTHGRARNSRPRDGLGRPLPHDASGVPPVPDDLVLDAAATLTRAQQLIDDGLPFQAHEVLEARWKSGPERERPYWKGLAQAAVALTHLRRGNRDGAESLALRAIDTLTGTQPLPPGLDIASVTRQLTLIAGGGDQGLRIAATS